MDSARAVAAPATSRWVDDLLAELERRGVGQVKAPNEPEPPSVDEMMAYLEVLLEHGTSRPWSLFHRGDKGCQGVESKSARTMVFLAGGGELAERTLNLELAIAAVHAAPHLMRTITSLRAVAKAADQEFQAMVAAFELQAARAEKAEAAVGAVLEALGSDVELAMRHLDAKELGNHVAELREEACRAEKAEKERDEAREQVRHLEEVVQHAQRVLDGNAQLIRERDELRAALDKAKQEWRTLWNGRAYALQALGGLVHQGSPHEDRDCPEDDTCECKLAALINAVFRGESPEWIRQMLDGEEMEPVCGGLATTKEAPDA